MKHRAVLRTLDLRAACFLAGLLPCACAEDDEGSSYLDVSAGQSDGVPRCQVDQREIGLTEATPIGVTASELFGWISGPHTEPLRWLSPGSSASHAQLDGFGPEQGSSELLLDFEPIGARWVTRSPLDEASVGLCPASLGLDVSLHLSTASGALDERVQTTLEATQAGFATLQAVYLPLDGLQGSFTAQISLGPGYDHSQPPQLWLSLTLSEAGATGKLVLVALVRDGRSELGIVPTLARFPDETERCPEGMYLAAPDHGVDGVSREGVLQQLNGASPALLDGGPATLELEYAGAGERACMQPRSAANPTTTVWFPAAARLRSSDGRIDGTLQTTLRGNAGSGALHSQASARSDLSDAAAAAAAAPSHAILDPIDFSGFDGGSFAFQADVTVASGTGSLIVNGIDAPQCPAVTTSDLRCTTTSKTELWGARWSTP